MKRIIQWQEKILKVLAGKAKDYCLGGGTALSRIYFHHRQSYDLDFFTSDFNRKGIISIVEYLTKASGKDFKLVREQQHKDKVCILIFSAALPGNEAIKIDFIEDYLERIKSPIQVEGVSVLSLEDIYLRKINAIAGVIKGVDEIGRGVAKGGRQEAKDFFDLYFLSHTFMNLSDFALKYCNFTNQELLVHWFRTYSRMNIKTGLLDLIGAKKIDYRDMEKHFKAEIDKLLDWQIGKI